jgi:hypothetical protein
MELYFHYPIFLNGAYSDSLLLKGGDPKFVFRLFLITSPVFIADPFSTSVKGAAL